MEEQIRRSSADKGKRNCRSHYLTPTRMQKCPKYSQNGSFETVLVASRCHACHIAETASGLGDAPARTSWEMMMNIVANQELFFVFDDKGVRAMGAVVRFAHFNRVRELVAKRIIEAAKNGERIRFAFIRKQSWGQHR